MRRSEDRILTTHVGSLIRPDLIRRHLRAKQKGEGYDAAAHRQNLKETVAEVVRQQDEVGVDVVSDGEFGKGISWSQYVIERVSGFERRPSRCSARVSPRVPCNDSRPAGIGGVDLPAGPWPCNAGPDSMSSARMRAANSS
jgi:5-methyltetrahydropteroyltriglutamate--homocysteine methyltransferase